MTIHPPIEVPEKCHGGVFKCDYCHYTRDGQWLSPSDTLCALFNRLTKNGLPCQQCLDERLKECERIAKGG